MYKTFAPQPNRIRQLFFVVVVVDVAQINRHETKRPMNGYRSIYTPPPPPKNGPPPYHS